MTATARRTLLALACLASLGAAPDARAAKRKEKPTVITGELIDLDCYMADSKKRGADHDDCARRCVEAGSPVAVLRSGVLYLLLGRDMKPVNEIVLPFVGKWVKVTGRKVHKGEMFAILLDQIEEAPAPKRSRKSS